jgi:hypothetical protein
MTLRYFCWLVVIITVLIAALAVPFQRSQRAKRDECARRQMQLVKIEGGGYGCAVVHKLGGR